MTQTLTTDELRQIVETDHTQCGDAAAMARELLAAREAVPVAADYVGVMGIGVAHCDDYAVAWTETGRKLGNGMYRLYAAPPAPEVQGNVREALTLALRAMEFMGDTLNNMDAVCSEDVEYVTPAFTAVRELLAATPAPAALRHGNYPEIPEGWKLVPVEPTESMLLVLGMTGSFESMTAKYQKMLAAAPEVEP